MFTEWSREYPFLEAGQPKENVLILRFRDGATRNEKLSANGPAVYDRVFQIQVMAVGQKQSAPEYTFARIEGGVEKIVENRIYERFKPAIEAWRAGLEPTHDGTPLEHWPLMTMEIVRAFKDANVLTVEMLANAGDQVGNAVRAPFYEWRAKAKAWLEQATKGAAVKDRADLAAAQEQIKALEAQVSRLLAAQNGEAGSRGFDKPKRGKRNGKSEDIEITIPDEAAAEFDEERV